jgi:signal transduction histidine kinase
MTNVMTDVKSSPNPAQLPAAPASEPVSASDSRHRIHELTTALAARDSFIALVGHELRNSIAPMVLLAEQFTSLAEDPQVSPTMASRVAMLTRNLHKFVATIDRVAEVSDLRRGKLRLDLARVDLVDVVETVCRDAGREAKVAGAELVIDASEPVVGRWDPVRVKQIAANLVSNAVRYGGGGRIELTVRVRDDRAELTVRDRGPGIDPAALPYLFDAFDHGRGGKRAAGGFGIGLWLVKTLCTAMNGSVTAENSADGGACFRVMLPRG